MNRILKLFNKVKRNLAHTIILIGILFTNDLFSQQVTHYSMYYFNNFMLNPAVAGSRKCYEIKLGYRTQWVGFESAPQTMFISGHGRLKSKNSNNRRGGSSYQGLGAYVIKDDTGPIGKLGAHLAYAIHIPLNRYITAGVGLSIGVMQFRVSSGELRPAVAPDPAVSSLSSISPDANLGVWLYSKDFYAGLAARQVLPVSLTGTQNKLATHLFLHLGYKYMINDDIALIPSTLVRMGMITPATFDVTVKADWRNIIWLGISYRKVEGMVGMVGFTLGNFLDIGYAFDYTLSKLQQYSSNSHEIIIGIRPKCGGGKNSRHCPAYM
ncbi:MAG TPA: type IX secretion system membrane protein PorP/SprF [Flavobacteriales bacterium]|nr:type IX secretion system membrane protein PorP/SprF [Flavobacteriales bacterium]